MMNRVKRYLGYGMICVCVCLAGAGLAAQGDPQAPSTTTAKEAPAAKPIAEPTLQAPANVTPNPPKAGAPPEVVEAGGEPAYLGAVVDDREDRGRGVRIERIIPGGPAEMAGLRKGDLITGLGGIRVRQIPDFAAIVEQVAPGSRLTFEVLRGEKREKIDVIFGSRSGKPQPEPANDLRAPLDLRPEGGLITPAKPQIPKPPAPAKPTPSTGDDHARIEMLQRRIEQLERRVEALERMVSRQFAQ